MAMGETLRQLAEEFGQLPDEFLRYTYLVELGRLLPAMKDGEKTDAHLFRGCQARVWLALEAREGRLSFQADSDAAVMRGILFLFYTIYHGTPLEEAAGGSIDLLGTLGLKAEFPSQRQEGIAGIERAVRSFCMSAIQRKRPAAEMERQH